MSNPQVGDLAYFNGAQWVRLPKGGDGQILSLSSGALTWTGTGTTSAPTSVGRPTISGTLTTGSLLTGGPGSWTGSPTPTFTYRWLRNGAAISGATAATHTLVSADELQNVVLEVTGSNGIGNPIVVLSDPVVPTAAGAPWTPPAGASTPESRILVGPSATYQGASIDMVTGGSHTVNAQSTSNVAGTLSIETSADQSSWASAGSQATSLSGTKQVAGLQIVTTNRYARIKYVNGATGQLEFSIVRWVA